MFTPFHITSSGNRITLWQSVICGIPSFQFEDFLFAQKKKKMFLYSCLPPLRFDSRNPSGFHSDLCEGPDKTEQRTSPDCEGKWEHSRNNNVQRSLVMRMLLVHRLNWVNIKQAINTTLTNKSPIMYLSFIDVAWLHIENFQKFKSLLK